MNNLEIFTQVLGVNEDEQFVTTCNQALARIAELAPSDSNVSMNVNHDGSYFISSVRLASLNLHFSIVAKAKSPYMAVESVMKDALDRVHLWAATRSSGSHP